MIGLRRLATLALLITAVTAQAQRGLGGLPSEDFEEGDLDLMRAAIAQVAERPDGETVRWLNPDTGNRGEVTALSSGQRDGRDCRLLEVRSVSRRGADNTLRYPVCRQPDGSWKAEWARGGNRS